METLQSTSHSAVEKLFGDKLRPHFVKGACSVFLSILFLLIRARRGHTEMVDWIGKFELLLKRAKDSSLTEQQREAQYQADLIQVNAEEQPENNQIWTPPTRRPE